jgi:hypothetical protein
MTLSDVIKRLHQNSRNQTSVTFNAAFTDKERKRELRRLQREAHELGELKEQLRTQASLMERP